MGHSSVSWQRGRGQKTVLGSLPWGGKEGEGEGGREVPPPRYFSDFSVPAGGKTPGPPFRACRSAALHPPSRPRPRPSRGCAQSYPGPFQGSGTGPEKPATCVSSVLSCHFQNPSRLPWTPPHPSPSLRHRRAAASLLPCGALEAGRGLSCLRALPLGCRASHVPFVRVMHAVSLSSP